MSDTIEVGKPEISEPQAGLPAAATGYALELHDGPNGMSRAKINEFMELVATHFDAWDYLTWIAKAAIEQLKLETADRRLTEIEDDARNALLSVLRRGA